MLTTKNKTMKDLRKFIAELEEEARFKLAIAKTCSVSPTRILKETGGKVTIDQRIDNMTLIQSTYSLWIVPSKPFSWKKTKTMPSKVKLGFMKKMSIIKQDSSIIAMKCTYGNGIKVRYTGANITEHGATGEIFFPTRKLLVNLKKY